MGIQNLIPFVEKATRRGSIEEWEGGTVAVDISCWLHRGIFGCVDKIMTGEPTRFYVEYCLKYVNMLLLHNIHVILVFDGESLPAKADTNKGRRERRLAKKEEGLKLLKEGKTAEARACFEQATQVTPDIVRDVITEFRKIDKVDIIVAPYEADAEIAFLVQEGLADVAITEDSDLIAFGCKKIFYKMDQLGKGVVFERKLLYKCLSLKSPEEFSFTNFRRICILAGCDYISEGLKGVGISKAAKFFAKTSKKDLNVLKRIPLYLNMPKLKVTSEFIDKFQLAESTFLYQMVFDPRTRKRQTLTPHPDPSALNTSNSSQDSVSSSSQSTQGSAKEYSYAGGMISPTKDVMFSVGNLDTYTKDKVDDYDPHNLGRWSVWNSAYDPNAMSEPVSSFPSPAKASAFEIHPYRLVSPTKNKVAQTYSQPVGNQKQVTRPRPKSSVSPVKLCSTGTPLAQELAVIYGMPTQSPQSSSASKNTAIRQKKLLEAEGGRLSKYFSSPSILPVEASSNTRNPFKIPRKRSPEAAYGPEEGTENGEENARVTKETRTVVETSNCETKKLNEAFVDPDYSEAPSDNVNDDDQSEPEVDNSDNSKNANLNLSRKTMSNLRAETEKSPKKKKKSPRKRKKSSPNPNFLSKRKGWTMEEQHEYTISQIMKGAVSAKSRDGDTVMDFQSSLYEEDEGSQVISESSTVKDIEVEEEEIIVQESVERSQQTFFSTSTNSTNEKSQLSPKKNKSPSKKATRGGCRMSGLTRPRPPKNTSSGEKDTPIMAKFHKYEFKKPKKAKVW